MGYSGRSSRLSNGNEAHLYVLKAESRGVTQAGHRQKSRTAATPAALREATNSTRSSQSGEHTSAAAALFRVTRVLGARGVVLVR